MIYLSMKYHYSYPTLRTIEKRKHKFTALDKQHFSTAVKVRLHRVFAFVFFCIIQCRKRFHPLLVSMGDANARCKRALKLLTGKWVSLQLKQQIYQWCSISIETMAMVFNIVSTITLHPISWVCCHFTTPGSLRFWLSCKNKFTNFRFMWYWCLAEMGSSHP